MLDRLINRLNPASPRGIVWSTADWVNEARHRWGPGRTPQPPAWRKVLEPEAEVADQVAAPDVEGGVFDRVRWGITPPASLTYVAGARVLGAEGAVLSPDNRLFAEYTFPPGSDWRAHSCFRRRRIPPVKSLQGWYATIAMPTSEYYFHWLLESLPRMKYLDGYRHLLDGIIVSARLKPFHVDALARLGFPRSKLIELDPQSHYEVEHLFLPMANWGGTPPYWIADWYRSTFLPPQPTMRRRRRIFVSREDATVRRLANEAAIVAALAPLGFEKVVMTPMSFSAQAELFEEADVIVGPHGGGFSNLVFCRRGTRMVEIMSRAWMPPCYYALARAVAVEYRCVVSEPCGAQGVGPGAEGQLSDFSVAPDRVVAAVRALTGEVAA